MTELYNTNSRAFIAHQAATVFLDEEEDAGELEIADGAGYIDVIENPATSRRLAHLVFPALLTVAATFDFGSASATGMQARFFDAMTTRASFGADRREKQRWVVSDQGIHYTDSSLADKVVLELEKLKDGWAGDGTMAPARKTVTEVAAVLDLLNSNALMPSIEVDEEDGAVSLRWITDDKQRSFSLVFQGSGRVTGVIATRNPPRSKPVSAAISDEVAIAAMLDDPKVREVIAS